MGILTRYLIRAHVGPFVFALTALTGLLFLNAVAQRLEDLAGKGLTWDVIVDFLVLSLPHTVALTLPMAVLVSVLYAFSDLTANNEVTAMKAGGIRPERLLLPLLGVGTIVALGMLLFNDWVLPEANHRLKNLLLDINRKSPTFTLREQVVNNIQSEESGERFFLQASRIDNASNALFDVVIVDSNDPDHYRTTVADSGNMAFNEARTDLYLVLFDGVIFETSEDPPGTFQKAYFERQIVPLRGVGNEMERRFADAGERGDREMTLAMLSEETRERLAEIERLRVESRERSREAVAFALGRTNELPLGDPEGLWSAAYLSQESGSNGALSGERWDEATRRVAVGARTRQTQVSALAQTVSRYRVETHKKYSLAVACVVFVLVGAPLAVRFPRGGLGMVIAVSTGIFAFYWMGLIGGESLADRGIASPALGMWLPNVVFGILGLLLVKRMGREAATMRGGGWDDLFFTLREGLSAPLRRFRRKA